MNERLDDLMYQAGLTAQGCWDKMDAYDREAIMKLAELIVQECGVVAYKTYCQTPGALGIQYKKAIEEHFGVEQ